MDIPKNRIHPIDAVQCDECGGHGCLMCDYNGWFEMGHPKGRVCKFCQKPLAPEHVAVYCSNACALADA